MPGQVQQRLPNRSQLMQPARSTVNQSAAAVNNVGNATPSVNQSFDVAKRGALGVQVAREAPR
ncbi:MAG: hypothetical protein QM775_10215 [Pirellulales bacterium]